MPHALLLGLYAYAYTSDGQTLTKKLIPNSLIYLF